jgi:hypothetical protein
MLKMIAVVRTVVLLLILGSGVRATPWSLTLPPNSAILYDKCRVSLSELQVTAWLAIGWIALETVVGWWLATRKPKLHETGVPKPGGEPPFAPPPHR